MPAHLCHDLRFAAQQAGGLTPRGVSEVEGIKTHRRDGRDGGRRARLVVVARHGDVGPRLEADLVERPIRIERDGVRPADDGLEVRVRCDEGIHGILSGPAVFRPREPAVLGRQAMGCHLLEVHGLAFPRAMALLLAGDHADAAVPALVD